MSEMAVFYRVSSLSGTEQTEIEAGICLSEEIMKNETLLPLELLRNCWVFFPSEGMLLHRYQIFHGSVLAVTKLLSCQRKRRTVSLLLPLIARRLSFR